jgi:hypothetical protein
LKLHFEKVKKEEGKQVRLMGKEMDLRFINLIILFPLFLFSLFLLAFAYQGKDIVFRFIIE